MSPTYTLSAASTVTGHGLYQPNAAPTASLQHGPPPASVVTNPAGVTRRRSWWIVSVTKKFPEAPTAKA